ncbi:Protein N-terminal amidase, partial [Termitomyces sp. J132]
IGEVNANIARAREFCFKLTPHSIDLLCFPEMAFTGYVFDSAEAILPYLEEPRTGPSSLFCQEVAKHLGCYVAGGYPERLSEEERRAESQAVHTPVGANSAILYGPSGEWVGGYRKTNLFETDKTWAKAGTGFVSFSLTLPHVTSTESENAPAPNSLEMSIAICMDLNPAPSHEQTPSVEWPYELADYCVRNKSRLLVLLDAWLDSDSDDGEDEEDAGDGASDNEPNWHTLRYWAARLQPLWGRDWRRPGSNETLLPPHETIVVVCNRTGTENGV